MKKILSVTLLSFVLILSACGSGADKEYTDQLKQAEKNLEKTLEDSKRLEEISNQIDETSDLIEEVQDEMGIEDELVDDVDGLSESEARELIEYEALGQDDTLTDIVIENGEVKAIIEIADHDIFDDKSLLAESMYASAGDAFLEYDGWDVLTIEFIDVGKVSMHRSEKEANEYGLYYFPLEKIIDQLE